MTKKQFTNAINELLYLKKCEEDLNEAFGRFNPDFNYISFTRHETLIVQVLEIAMNDTNEWISHWLFELECGKNAKKGSVIQKGKDVPMKTISDLYNCIKKI